MLTSLAFIFLFGLSMAAIGSVPISMGLPCGNIVLSIAVLGIIITAPLGAFGIDFSYKRLLDKRCR